MRTTGGNHRGPIDIFTNIYAEREREREGEREKERDPKITSKKMQICKVRVERRL